MARAYRFLSIIAVLALLLAAYRFAIRPAQLSWGATAEEFARPMPGDELLPDPTLLATRAVTIAAPPEKIWPWLVQIGYDRAGFYGYDLIENLGSRRGIRSAARIVPELQHPAEGDRVYMSRIAYLVIPSIVPGRFLLWADEANPPHGVFAFGLYPVDADRTRLVLRFHLKYHASGMALLLDLFTEFADHVAVPKMLLGVRDRVVGRPIPSLAGQAFEIAVWLVSFLAFAASLVGVLFRRSWLRAWIVALGAGAVLLFTLYARQPVWVGALLETGILAALWGPWLTSRRDSAA